ncbi:MAG: hypothetical protein NXI27_25530 [Alphaproteobacteria bacterium]|nr:hypothetical protein [Alphaproteobacteria bacterium]
MPIARFALFVILSLVLFGPASAQDTLIYQGPVPVKLQGATANLPIALFASPAPEHSDQIQLHAHADVTDLKPILLNQLQKLAKERLNVCELRLSVLDAVPRLSPPQIVLNATLQAEIWLCTSLLKTTVGSDSFVLDIGVVPDVRAGRLHLTPGSVNVAGMDDIVRSIGGEVLLEQLFEEAIARFNRNPKLTSLPEPLVSAGYSYHDVATGNAQIGPNTLRISIIGPNDVVSLLATLANLR